MTINPTKDAEVFVSIDDDSTDSGLFPFALSCAIHDCSCATVMYTMSNMKLQLYMYP